MEFTENEYGALDIKLQMNELKEIQSRGEQLYNNHTQTEDRPTG